MADLTKAVVAAIQDGLAITPRPFAHIAERLGTDENTVLEIVRNLQATGTIKRFGVVVRHRELGYRANAMVVWDVPDEKLRETARLIAADPAVTLCYQRPRWPPRWPYNLFCMIHGLDRASVQSKISTLRHGNGIQKLPYSVLFSRQRFKQRGAVYASPETTAGAHDHG